MHKSIWYDFSKTINEKELKKDINTDVLIIGGGITGISIAYQLVNSPYKVCLVEKGTIGCQTTSRSTGKITYLQEDLYNKIIKIYNQNIAKLYLKSQIEAISMIKNIINNNHIDCDLISSPSILFTSTKNNIKKIKQISKFLSKNNIKTEEHNLKKYNSKYAIKVDDTYTINPLKYIQNLKQLIKNKITIYENTNIIKCYKENDIYISKTDNNSIKSKIVIIANHYPWFLKPGVIPLKTYQEKSTIIAYKNENNNYSGINIDSDTISFRTYKSHQIYLNDTHKICDNDSMNIDTFKHKLAKSKIDYIWSNQDLITFDYMPFIGKIEDNMYIATGYNTWGLTNGTLAGIIIKDLIIGHNNRYVHIFNPKRSQNLFTLKNTLSNLLYNIKAYLKPKKQIYIKNDKHIYQVKSKCPHMKCGLTLNKEDQTWDCPCHGSRFDINGHCIQGPSTKDIDVIIKN